MERPPVCLTLEHEALKREWQARLWQAFQALPARQREVFALRYVEGWSTAAVAEALGLRSCFKIHASRFSKSRIILI
jgi:RNA polymerase sigma factor (sigma-70 family)